MLTGQSITANYNLKKIYDGDLLTVHDRLLTDTDRPMTVTDRHYPYCLTTRSVSTTLPDRSLRRRI